MKVALVGPELEENLSLRYLASALAAAGHEPRLFDFHGPHQIGPMARDVAAWQPQAVGLSMVFTARAREFLDLAAALRRESFAGHIVAGGHFASFHAADLLRDFPALDTIIHGEGEEALVDLLAHLEPPRIPATGVPLAACPPVLSETELGGSPHPPRGTEANILRGGCGDPPRSNLASVAGLSYREDGAVCRTAPRRNPDDLDLRPWPLRPEVFQTYLGLPIANMLSSRGCFGRCSFCSIRAWYRENPGKELRQRSPEEVAREMAMLYYDHGIRIYNFHDDNFFLPRPEDNVRRFRALKERLDGLGVGRIAIQIKARPDSVRPEVLAPLMDLGLFRVFLGVESNAVAGLAALGRGIRRETNQVALSLLRGLGLHTSFNLLMFEPDATVSDLRDNVAFIRRWAQVPLNFCSTVVYSGTPLEARLREQGRLEGDYFAYHYRMGDPRVQRVFDFVRHVFTARQFDDDGMNLQTMKIEYYLQILRHFWPERVRPTLQRKAADLVRRVNTDSADLLDEICNFVESHDLADEKAAAALAAEMLARRQAFDAKAFPQSQEIVGEIRRLGAAGERRGLLAGAASIAAAALLATAIGCNPDGSHAHEMAPAPTTGPKDLPPPPPPVPAPTGTAMCEMAPVPVNPAPTPTAAPTPTDRRFEMCEMAPRPVEHVPLAINPVAADPDAPPIVEAAFVEGPRYSMQEWAPVPTGSAPSWISISPAPTPTGTAASPTPTAPQPSPTPTSAAPSGTAPAPTPTASAPTPTSAAPTPTAPPKAEEVPLAKADTDAVEKRVKDTYQAAVTTLALRHGVAGKTLQVTLSLDAKGAVQSLRIKNPAASGSDAFRDQLTGMVLQWKFPGLKTAGAATVSLTMPKEAPPPPKSPNGWGATEMAPMPAPRD
jgi:anaerobic magnesium-protoporphyrin IX monomethyl ester cyclase